MRSGRASQNYLAIGSECRSSEDESALLTGWSAPRLTLTARNYLQEIRVELDPDGVASSGDEVPVVINARAWNVPPLRLARVKVPLCTDLDCGFLSNAAFENRAAAAAAFVERVFPVSTLDVLGTVTIPFVGVAPDDVAARDADLLLTAWLGASAMKCRSSRSSGSQIEASNGSSTQRLKNGGLHTNRSARESTPA